MNRLTKSSSRRGNAVPRACSLSARCPVPSAPTADASASRILPTGASVASSINTSPVGGWWPTSSPNEGLYPPGGFANYLESNPFANHPSRNNITENFHFVGAAMGQSSMSPIDLGARRTPSPTHETDDPVDDEVDYVDTEETETINVDQDSRTDRRLNYVI